MARQTSIEVFKQIRDNGLLSKRRMEVYEIVFNHGPMTSNETFDYSELNGIDGYRHNANARMTELRELGVVYEAGTKQCSKSGNTVILWDVTDKLPVKPERKITKDEKLKSLVGEIVELGKTIDPQWKPQLRTIYSMAKSI